MKFILIGFLSCFVVMCLASAATLSFSPTSLIYNLELGEEVCKPIYFNSDGDNIKVYDRWAINYEQLWKVKNMNQTTPDQLEISFTSPVQSGNYKKVYVCLTAHEEGQFKGGVYIAPTYQGNQVAQGLIWIKVTAS